MIVFYFATYSILIGFLLMAYFLFLLYLRKKYIRKKGFSWGLLKSLFAVFNSIVPLLVSLFLGIYVLDFLLKFYGIISEIDSILKYHVVYGLIILGVIIISLKVLKSKGIMEKYFMAVEEKN